MNEDRIVGAGRTMLGKAERAVGDGVGSPRLEGDGVVDQVAGTIQHGYGRLKDAVTDVLDDAPGVVTDAIHRGRDLGRQGEDAVRDRLGDNGPLYLLGGAIALFALGAYALTQNRSVAPGRNKPKPKPKAKGGPRSHP